MKSLKRLGIWMDHSTANIMELSNDKIITVTLDSTPAFPEQIENLRMDERLMHNKVKNEQSDFYEKLSYIINDYDEVLLFGPTEAKTELFNLLKDNRKFEKIKISVEPTDKITENQQHAFLKNFYKKK
jgi:molybdopterin converting factor small subunit